LIDESLERYKFPHYMTKHVENYHRDEIDKPSKSAPKVQEVFNRKTFLTMLMIALSDKEPTTKEFEKVKNEMGRLAFVGDSIIILCQVINMIFNGKKSFTEKDLDAVKNKTVKTEKLKQRAEAVGLDYLII
jgi:dsRNA-specific ribonuclease